MEFPDTLEQPDLVVFNGKSYKKMGGRSRYYLSQSKSNLGRRNAKGLHVAIWEYVNAQVVPLGFEIHHKDSNSFNNHPSNLECITRSEHRKTINFRTEAVLKNLDRIRPLTIAWHRSEEGRKWHSLNGKRKRSKNVVTYCLFCTKKIKSHRGRKYCGHNCEVKAAYHRKRSTHAQIQDQVHD